MVKVRVNFIKTRWMCSIDCEKYPNDCINEKLVVEHIDAFVNKGFLLAGYNVIVFSIQYINIDDCWAEMERGKDNVLVANRTRFPHGLKWLAEYANSKGIKLGSYTDYGTKTCEGYPGSKEYVDLDGIFFC